MGRLDNPARIEGIEGGISAQETGSHPLRALLWMAVASVGGLLYFRRFLEPSDISSMAMVSSAGEEAEKAEKAEADVKVAEVLPDNEEAEITTIAESQAGWLLRYGIGRVCFWCQLWLSVIAATVAIFSVQYAYSGSAAAFGLGFTMISTAASFLSTLWTLRCRRIGKLLRREVETKDGKRPTKGNVIRLLWSGLLINSQGLLAAIVGIQANAGLLLAQSLQAGQTVMVPGFGRGVAAFDVFAQLAQAQALFSLIIGTCLALHTLRCISKPFARPATK
jgi:hypothetical protein